MEKVLILVKRGFEDHEFVYPYYRFQEARYEVAVVGPQADATYWREWHTSKVRRVSRRHEDRGLRSGDRVARALITFYNDSSSHLFTSSQLTMLQNASTNFAL